MKKYLSTSTILFAAIQLSWQTDAYATNGYFAHGYSIKSKSMGGADLAAADHGLAGAVNPAGLIDSADRLDIGLDWFRPQRSARRFGAAAASFNGSAQSGRENFLIPEIGFSRHLNEDVALGLAIYGNGGLNTTYEGGQINCGGGAANLLCGQGKLGVDLTQLIIAPTLAVRIGEQSSIGVAPLFAVQQFEAYGLQAFDNAPGFPPFTGVPGAVTNKGKARSHGVGYRLGWQSQISEQLRLGASYSGKIGMSEFDEYRGLFAGAGSFDIPANFGIGAAIKFSPKLDVLLDFQRINFSDVPAIGNLSAPRAPLGANNGPGFGWEDVNVWKLGVSYQASDFLELRAGLNHGNNPVTPRDVTFNILAPGVIEDHITVGFGYKSAENREWNVALMMGLENNVQGRSLLNDLPGLSNAAGQEEVQMKQLSMGISYTWLF